MTTNGPKVSEKSRTNRMSAGEGAALAITVGEER